MCKRRNGRALARLLVVAALGAVLGLAPAAEATLPGENGKIAFTGEAVPFGPFEIFSINPDGTERVNLTNHPAIDRESDWSPDGQRIAFMTRRDGNFEVYVMNADGTNPTRLTNHSARDGTPKWSPDGQELLFVSNRTGNSQIFIMNADGSDVRHLTNVPGGGAVEPDWSPDGSRIVFTGTPTGGTFDPIGAAPSIAVLTMRADGSQVRQLTPLEMNAADADWSPDGSRIVFSNNFCNTCDLSDLFVMRPNGSEITQLTTDFGNNIRATWSPDGETIAFTHFDAVSVADCCGPADTYLLDTEDGKLVNNTNTPDLHEGVPDWQPLPDVD